MKRAIFMLAALTLFLTTAASAHADIIFNNLNNGNYYTGGEYSSHNSPSPLGSFETAQSFPLARSYTLDSITIPLEIRTTDTNNEVTIRFWNSTNGLPSTVLESWDVKD